MSEFASTKLSVLVVEDDPMVSLMIAKILELNAYSVQLARDGEEGLKSLENFKPDIIMLDINMPKLNGFEVCRRLKADPRLEKIPVLMISGNPDREERLKGIEVGAEDFVVKPFNYDELLTRVLSTIKRAKKDIDAHPLTYLPGTSSVERALRALMEKKAPFAALKADLKDFKIYNERYGFSRGDEVIRSVARMIQGALDPGKDFLGHLGSDDFFVLTEPDRAEDVSRKILKSFENARAGFYELDDSRNGYIETMDRKGQRLRHPLMNIAVGAVCDTGGQFDSMGMVQKLCDEVLALAKTRDESSYMVNRRKLGETSTGAPPKKARKKSPKKSK